MEYLYRGVSKKKYDACRGKLLSNGSNSSLTMEIGDEDFKIGNQFIIGDSKENIVRLHHIESGKNDGCAVSTTRDIRVALVFALEMSEIGYIYVIDKNKLEENNIEKFELKDLKYPEETEITLVNNDCRDLSLNIVFKILPVSNADLEKQGTDKYLSYLSDKISTNQV